MSLNHLQVHKYMFFQRMYITFAFKVVLLLSTNVNLFLMKTNQINDIYILRLLYVQDHRNVTQTS